MRLIDYGMPRTITLKELDEAGERIDRARGELLAHMKHSPASGFDDDRRRLADELKRSTDEYWSLISRFR